jgi:hypothetical protein
MAIVSAQAVAGDTREHRCLVEGHHAIEF